MTLDEARGVHPREQVWCVLQLGGGNSEWIVYAAWHAEYAMQLVCWPDRTFLTEAEAIEDCNRRNVLVALSETSA